MRPWLPSVQQERWLTLADRFPEHRQHATVVAGVGAWHGAGMVLRLALFALGLAVASTATGIGWLILPPPPLLVCGTLLYTAAEWLILKRAMWNGGMNEALAVTGLLMFAFWLVGRVGPAGDVGIAAATAAGLGAAGGRLRNPLFTTGAMLALVVTITLAVQQHADLRTTQLHYTAGLTCLAMALAALGVGALPLQRPSSDRMLDWLVIVLPIAGYLWVVVGEEYAQQPDLPGRSLARWLTLLALLGFAALALRSGLRRRRHAPLVASMLCVACAGYELQLRLALSPGTKLLLAGGLLLASAGLLERWLRTPRNGLTSRRLSDREGPLDLLPLAGAALLGPQTAVESAPAIEGQGGSFGGGGASGQF